MTCRIAFLALLSVLLTWSAVRAFMVSPSTTQKTPFAQRPYASRQVCFGWSWGNWGKDSQTEKAQEAASKTETDSVSVAATEEVTDSATVAATSPEEVAANVAVATPEEVAESVAVAAPEEVTESVAVETPEEITESVAVAAPEADAAEEKTQEIVSKAADESVVAETVSAKKPLKVPTKTERYTVYVGNLPYSATIQKVRELFEEYVEVQYVNLPPNPETGSIKGYAFVDVGSEEDIAKVVSALQGKELEGRPLRVSRTLAKDQIRSTRKEIGGSKKLYIGNLAFASTKEDLREYLSQFGQVLDIFIPVNSYGEPRGFAFASIKEEDADKVLEATNGEEFMGRSLIVNYPVAPGEKAPSRRQRPKRVKIFVGNLSFYTAGGTLVEVFEEFGRVYDCYLPRDPKTNNSRGFGFITMDKDDAMAAIDALNGIELDGRMISVNEAKPKSASSDDEEDDGEAP